MLISILLFCVPLLYMAARVLWALFYRKMKKTRFRFYGVLISLGAAFLVAFFAKFFIGSDSFIAGAVLPSMFSEDEALFVFLTKSDACRHLLMGIVCSLGIPVLFLLAFMFFDLISWIVYVVVFSIGKKESAEEDVKESKLSIVATVAFALGNALIVLFVWMLPLGLYADLLPPILSCTAQTNMVSEEERASLERGLTDYVEPIDSHPVVNAFRFIGGSALSDVITTFPINGQYVKLSNEVGAISELSVNLGRLASTPYSKFGEEELAALDKISAALASSKPLPSALAELIHAATDAWIKGDDFFDVGADVLYLDQSGTLNGLTDKTVEILNKDTKKKDAALLCSDVDTLSSVLKILVRSGALSEGASREDLLSTLAKGDTVGEVIAVLESSKTMSALIPTINEITMDAIGTALGGDSKEYDALLGDLAGELNAVKGMDKEEQTAAVRALLDSEFEKNGLTLASAVLDSYADLMVEDLLSRDASEALTAEDLRSFFLLHAGIAPTEALG